MNLNLKIEIPPMTMKPGDVVVSPFEQKKYVVQRVLDDSKRTVTVYLCQTNDDEQVVIKVDSGAGGKQEGSIHAECSLYSNLVVHYHEGWEDGGLVYHVMDYCRGGDLFQTFDQFNDVRHLFIQMAKSLRDVHDMAYVHGDISPENFFVDFKQKNKNGKRHRHNELIRIADFGLSTKSHEDRRNMGGKHQYIAPEATRGFPKVYEDYRPSDIFSLGVCFYTIIFSRMLFSERRDQVYRFFCGTSENSEKAFRAVLKNSDQNDFIPLLAKMVCSYECRITIHQVLESLINI